MRTPSENASVKGKIMAKKAAKPAKPMKDLKTKQSTDRAVKGGAGAGDQKIP